MSLTSLLSVLSALTDLRWNKLRQFGEYLFWWRRCDVLYTVLENEIELELVDIKGETALYRKRKHVRFQQNDVFAFLDTA